MICIIYLFVLTDEIPDEQSALQRAPTAVAGMLPGQPTWPSNVISQVSMLHTF